MIKISKNLRSAPLNFLQRIFVGQPVRWRTHPRPGNLEQRLFRAVTKPVFKLPEFDPDQRYIARQQEKAEARKNNPHLKFLISAVQTEIFNVAHDNLLVFCHMNRFQRFELNHFRNQLFDLGANTHIYPAEVVLMAVRGTKWESIVTRLMLPGVRTACIVLPELDSSKCAKLLRACQLNPFSIPIGAVWQYRIFSIGELTKFISSSSQSAASSNEQQRLTQKRAELIGLLSSAASQTATLLENHQVSLTHSLSMLANRNEQSPSGISDVPTPP